jgi:hypothetical protein
MRKVVFGLISGCLVLNLTSLKAQGFKPLPEHSVTVSFLPAFGWLQYQKDTVKSERGFNKNTLNTAFGVTYRKQLSDRWQVAYGMDYRQYTGVIKFNGLRDSVAMKDWIADNGIFHNYYFIQIFNNTEEQKVTYLEPNIRLEYLQPLGSERIHLLVGLGLKYGINLGFVKPRLRIDFGEESNRMTAGTYERNAYFYENHNFIDALPSVNLYTYFDFLADDHPDFPSNKPVRKYDKLIFKHSFFALGEIGFRFSFSRKWHLKTMLNIQHSLLNVQNSQDPLLGHFIYSGIAASDIPGGVRAISAGVEIGLSYRFEIPPKPPKVKISKVPCPI